MDGPGYLDTGNGPEYQSALSRHLTRPETMDPCLC
jgi:hypothetical protein